MGTIYNITAEELHDRIVEDLRAYCRHFGFDPWPLDNPHGRPLEQTIRVLMELRVHTEVERLVEAHKKTLNAILRWTVLSEDTNPIQALLEIEHLILTPNPLSP